MDIDDAGTFEELPIFPLATTLFPGAILPLHIFEDRYKKMMNYAIENGGLFGLSYRSDAFVGRETPPELGSVGCVAKINAIVPLEEGKMNIISTGLIRYRVKQLIQATPFPLARVEAFGDDPEPDADLSRLLSDSIEMTKRFLATAQSLNELNVPIVQDLPEDPESFSLLAASYLPIDNESKQRLLEMTSTRIRLTRLKSYLAAVLSDFNERLGIRERAKGNGHGNLPEGEDG